MKKILLAVALVALLASCKSKNAIPDQTLLNTRWLLETVGEEKIDNSNEKKPIYLFMEEGSHQLNGFAGCNGFSGSYLVGKNDELMFVGAHPKLVKDKWLLQSIGEEKIDNSNKENPIYLTLEEVDGRNQIVGMAGCNRYFGEYELSGDHNLSLGKMGSTRMMCDKMEVESKYLKALEGVNSYEVDGLYLYLKSNGSTVLTYQVAEESIRFAIATTMMACDKMEFEGKFLQAVGDVRKYDVDGLNLYLMNAEGARILGFKAYYEE